MDRAIDIKRRAQRCIQSGDLAGALAEYEKLIAADASDPYTYVLLADLLYKMGDHPKAAERYLTAASCYEQAGLYKNAIAVGMKMLRLALSPGTVLERLANLHALDSHPTEASLYYTQSAEHLARDNRMDEAAAALRKAFTCNPENAGALERLAEVQMVAGDDGASAQTLAEAGLYHERSGRHADADRCRQAAERLRPGAVAAFEAQAPPPPVAGTGVRATGGRSAGSFAATPEPGRVSAFEETPMASGPPRLTETAPAGEFETDRSPRFVPPAAARSEEFEIERHPSAAQNGATAPSTESQDIERMLALAQTEFRAGHHAEAAQILAGAAAAYEALDRIEEAATIHRSLCRSPHATGAMLERWLANCERRGQPHEAAEVACELGDRAYQAGDAEEARAWFHRAVTIEPAHPLATRRLERLLADPGAVAEPAAPAPGAGTDGKIEVAVDRGQAVTFDFASMLAEFQRGVASQLAGDAQAHYDLAVAYREMGLIEQAIEAFRMAGRDMNFTQRCSEMVGSCLIGEGRFEEAVHELAQALAFAALDPEVAISVRYQLGIAFESSGRPHQALEEYERVSATDATFSDVALRISDLRKHLEAA